VSQLFQKGWFGIGVGVFIAVMAVGMIGLFTIPLPQSVYAVSPTSETIPGAFGYGIMTAILATPCAGPFMGSAIGWATQAGTATVLLVFASIGVGMALPYLLLAAFPRMVNKLPRTGPGSELLKQVMGLLLLAAAVFFIGTGLNATLSDGTASGGNWHWAGVWALVAVAGLWLAYRAVRIGGRKPAALTFAALGALTLAGAAWAGVGVTRAALSGTAHGVIAWVYYTPDRFQAALDAGDVVVMDFTADWCLNCKVLEKTVLEQPRIADLLNGDGVTPVKVDLTSEANVAGAAKLASLNRHTIPLLAVYRPDGSLVFLDDFYTADQVATAIAEARE
jgi:thiol:disulfide interchange protein